MKENVLSIRNNMKEVLNKIRRDMKAASSKTDGRFKELQKNLSVLSYGALALVVAAAAVASDLPDLVTGAAKIVFVRDLI